MNDVLQNGAGQATAEDRAANPEIAKKARIGVRPVQYPSFGEQAAHQEASPAENIGLIMDVPLQVAVELGRCKKNIKEILGLKMGSVIVLDRMAGEMVDVVVNGKLFARGEVVVIDESYGVRVTEIVTDKAGSQP